MRLVTLLLTAAVAATAQTPGSLPWASARVPPWNAGPGAPAAPAGLTPTRKALTLTVHLAQDGALRISDDKGILRLRMGLPGRPMKLWRDWGTPVAVGEAPALRFPAATPLLGGIGSLPVGALDFRPALEGLLWVLDDDEKVLTLIHPATARAVFLPLPGGRNLTLAFHPDRLEVQTEATAPEARADATCWSIPWLALLPQFIQLGQEGARHRPEGTVLLPFPRE